MDEKHKDLDTIDLEASRLAQYMHKHGRNIRTLFFGCRRFCPIMNFGHFAQPLALDLPQCQETMEVGAQKKNQEELPGTKNKKTKKTHGGKP